MTSEVKYYDNIRYGGIASVRYGVGLRPTAVMTTATNINAGFLTDKIHLK